MNGQSRHFKETKGCCTQTELNACAFLMAFFDVLWYHIFNNVIKSVFFLNFLHSSGVTLFHQFHVYFVSHQVCFYKGQKRDTYFLEDWTSLMARLWLQMNGTHLKRTGTDSAGQNS